MDGVIETVIRTLVSPGEKIVVSTPTFSVYGLDAAAASAFPCTGLMQRQRPHVL